MAAKGNNSVSKKAMIIMDVDDINELKQMLDLIYTELSDLNEMIRETKQEMETSSQGEE
jgi:hypothetical protein